MNIQKLHSESKEAPTDSPIEKSETGDKLSKVNKKFNDLVKKNNCLNIDNCEKFFTKEQMIRAKEIATKQANGTYRLTKQQILIFKELINEKLNQHEEHKEHIREEGRKEVAEQKNKEIEDIQKEHIKQIQAEREDKNNKVAQIKHKYEGSEGSEGSTTDDEEEDIQNKQVIKTSTNSPSIKNFIKDAYINGDYKLGADELRKRYTSGKYKQILKDTNINNVINDVMLYSTLETQKKKQKLAQLAQIGAFSPEAVANMDPNTQQEINDAIIAQSRITNAQKRLRYKLPINKPKARAAMLNQHINPMVFRGAYSTGNY